MVLRSQLFCILNIDSIFCRSATIFSSMAAHHLSASTDTAELHEILVCDICAEPYDSEAHRALFLDCHHTFCSQCLVLLAAKRQGKPNAILCPNCRHSTHLPADGVASLRINFYIEKLKAFSATKQPERDNLETDGCYKHFKQPIAFFCETCRTAICRDCTLLDHDKTAGHYIVNFTDAVSSQRDVLKGQLNSSRVSMTQIEGAAQQIESEMEQLLVCRDTVMKDLRSVIQTAHQKLEQCEHDVSKVILQQYEAQQCALLDKQLRYHRASTLLNKYINHSKDLVTTSHINEMTYITGKLAKAAEISKSNVASFRAESKCLTSDMITRGTAVSERLCHFGNTCFKSVLPTTLVFRTDIITAGFKSQLTIELLNDENVRLPIAACFLAIKLSDPAGSMLPVTLHSSHPECIVAFTPQISGRHEISAKYFGQKVSMEQRYITVESNNPVLKIGGPGNGNGRFNSPRDIAVDINGCLYVADTGNGLIQKFSADGTFISQFRVNGHDKDHTAFNLALDEKK